VWVQWWSGETSTARFIQWQHCSPLWPSHVGIFTTQTLKLFSKSKGVLDTFEGCDMDSWL
jgi:hypothetical protein